MEHKFNIFLAEKIGLEPSIILNNLIFWVEHNKANNTNFYDGKYWTYNSIEAYKKLFPYLTKHKIINALKTLEEYNLIYVGNYNKSNYDRTKWYSVNHENDLLKNTNRLTEIQSFDLLKNGNGYIENRTPIPDNKTTDNKTKDINININNTPKYDFKGALLENGFELELVNEWLEIRKSKKGRNSKIALEGFVREVQLSNLDKNKVLRMCVERSWVSFSASWVNKQTTQQPQPHQRKIAL